METTLNLNLALTFEQVADLARQLPPPERQKLAELLQDDDEPVTKAQLIEEIREAVRDVKLAKQGKLKLPTLQEFLDELPD